MTTPNAAAQDFADSFKTAANFPVHTTIHVDTEYGMPIMVRRSSFCFYAYVGVPLSHVLSGLEDFEIDCHWGVSFSEKGQPGTPYAPGYHWFGWDYGHYGDALISEDGLDLRESMLELLPPEQRAQLPILGMFEREEKKAWTLGEVIQQAIEVRSDLVMQTIAAQAGAIAAIQGIKAAPVALPSAPTALFNRKFKAMSRRRQKIALRKLLATF